MLKLQSIAVSFRLPNPVWRLLSCLALACLVVVTYWPGLTGGFVFDDFPNIVENTRLHVRGTGATEWLAAIFSSPASDLQRPLAMLSFAANHYFTGLDPWPMKLTNVAIHALNSILAFLLARKLVIASRYTPAGQSPSADWPALFVGACWALHPINLVAVLFVVQRMETLSHTFVFVGLLLYVIGRQSQLIGKGGWPAIGSGLVLCTSLGMLSKESAALLPLYAFLIEVCIFRFRASAGSSNRPLMMVFVGVLLVPAIVSLVWIYPRSFGEGAYASRDFTLFERLITEPRVLMDYLKWILVPDLGQLSLYHDDYAPSRSLFQPASTLVSILAVVSMISLAVAIRAKHPLVALGFLWFFGAHLLTATVIPLELVFEHRNYFASFGICLAMSHVLFPVVDSRQRGILRRVVALIILLLYGSLTHLRALEWSDQAQFSRLEAMKRPQSPRAAYDWARTLVVLGQYNADSPYTREAYETLERSRLVPGSGILPTQALLVLASRSGQPIDKLWWADLNARLKRFPVGPQERGAVASLTKCVVDGFCDFSTASMLEMFGAALHQGDNPEILNIYANFALNELRDPILALRLWQEAITRDPKNAQYRINHIKLLIAMGRHANAKSEITNLQSLGRFGQYDEEAAKLSARLRINEGPNPADTPQMRVP